MAYPSAVISRTDTLQVASLCSGNSIYAQGRILHFFLRRSGVPLATIGATPAETDSLAGD